MEFPRGSTDGKIWML